MILLATLLLAQSVEVTLPDGRTFRGQPDPKGEAARAEKLLAEPTAANLLAAARIYDDLWWFSKSIPVYTRGSRLFPKDFRFLRFRGHRNLSTRHFREGAADLERARRLAPDSFDVAYHLGLAYYLQGNFKKAAAAYGRCLAAAGKPRVGATLPEGLRGCHELDRQDNSRAAITEWMYRSLRRAGRPAEAAKLLDGIREGMTVTTNATYYQSLLYYKGLRQEASVLPAPGAATGNTFSTSAYGVAVHHLVEGRKARGCELLNAIAGERAWNAFGLIAAEADLARGACR
jgi:tetratricopeptide (TPR) repeat protein